MRFGGNRRRRLMIGGLLEALRALRDAGCARVYVDGSFVTRRLNPRDHDVCWDEAGVDIHRLLQTVPEFNVAFAGRQAMKARFGGEFFPAHEYADWRRTYLEYFQTDKLDGSRKGIILLNLGELP
ncbi:MAG: hypothetical protein U0531_21120 [Dehalococcoidia bacterium]